MARLRMGGARAAPPGTPPLPSRSCRRRQTPWRASRLQTEDGRTPPRRACALSRATPQSHLRAATPRSYWCVRKSERRGHQ